MSDGMTEMKKAEAMVKLKKASYDINPHHTNSRAGGTIENYEYKVPRFVAEPITQEVADALDAWDHQVGGGHYKGFKIQPMEFSMSNQLNALQHTILKYVCRYKDKNGKQDLEKARHALDMLIEWEYPG